MKLDPEVDAAFADLVSRLEAASPEVKAILSEGRAAGKTVAETLQQMEALVQSDPTLSNLIETVAAEALAPLRGLGRDLPSEISLASVTELDPTGITLASVSALDPAKGLARLDPLYEAYLTERVQFDGDAPELRTGRMPEGASPAVPVLTSARNPVSVGWMLEQAQSEVALEQRAIEQGRVDEVQGLLSDDSTALTLQGPALLAKLDRDTLPDPVGYERGQVPALREVEAPTGWGLLALTSEQQHQLAWKTISTTQGRKSIARAIRDLVVGGLQNDGHDVIAHEGEPARAATSEVLAYSEWTMGMSGPGSTQPSFAFADTAARSLVRKLEERLEGLSASGAVLDIIPINTVDVRKVGWAARLLRVDAAS